MLDDIIARYIQSYNARDIDGMLDCVTDDVVFETSPMPVDPCASTART